MQYWVDLSGLDSDWSAAPADLKRMVLRIPTALIDLLSITFDLSFSVVTNRVRLTLSLLQTYSLFLIGKFVSIHFLHSLPTQPLYSDFGDVTISSFCLKFAAAYWFSALWK